MPVPTVGVEEELLIVDETGTPSRISERIIAAARDRGLTLQHELSTCQVELNSKPQRHITDIHRDVLASRTLIAELASEAGAYLLSAAVPPIAPVDRQITATSRYQRIASHFGRIAYEPGICGAHVHVEVPNRAAAIAVGNHLRPWLPILLATTANSAIYDGTATGYASYRSIQWTRWPSAGPPPFFADEAHFDEFVADMASAGAIIDDGMIYWDVRPAREFPTVEIRVSDVPLTVGETALLAALVRALVMAALESIRADQPAPRVRQEHLRWAYWRSAHDGMGGLVTHPVGEGLLSWREGMNALLEHCEWALRDAGDWDLATQSVISLDARGNGAAQQLAEWERTGDASAVVRQAVHSTVTSTLG